MRRRNVQRGGVLLLACLLLIPAAYAEMQTVEGMGYGETRELAVEAAKRDAVERAVGLVIASETVVKNYALFSDMILSRSMGYVQSYDVIQESNPSEGMVGVKIRAVVGDILDEVLRDRIAMELLLSWMQKPRVLIAIAENNQGDEGSRVVENAVTEQLLDLGFNVIQGRDAGGTENVLGALTGGDGSFDASGADLIFAGTATSVQAPAPAALADANMVSVQAVVEVRAYRADTRSVLASHNEVGSAYHINTAVAGARALEQAAEKATQALVSDVVTTWSLQQSNTLPVEVVLEAATFKHRKNLLAFLEQQEFVVSVAEQGLMDGRFTCVADIEGRAESLAEVLDGFNSEGKAWNVTGMTSGKIVMTPH